jgi:glutamyl-tRNA synthetase
VFAHLPTVLTPEGEKLSKRHGARGVLQYRDDGYLPEAIVNYLARLGWAHGDDEIFGRQQFVEWFDLSGLSSSPGRFDPEKLRWVNEEHLKRMPETDLGAKLAPYLVAAGLDPAAGPAPGPVAVLLRDRVSTLVEMADAAHYFYAPISPTPEAIAAHLNADNRPVLVELLAEFETLEWSRGAIGAALKRAAARHGLKAPQVMMPMRVLVAGTAQTPAIDAVLSLLARDTVRTRLAGGLAR